MTIIAFEGIDACGKETQVRLLKQQATGGQLHLSYPNYQSKTGRKISELLKAPDAERNPLVLQALMTVNRYEEQHVIADADKRGDLVILDRYWLSGLVYGQTDGLPLSWLLEVHSRLIQPHHWVVLDIPVGESFRRRPKREDKYEANEKRLHEARRLYREAQDYLPDLVVINANQDPMDVHEAVLNATLRSS